MTYLMTFSKNWAHLVTDKELFNHDFEESETGQKGTELPQQHSHWHPINK